MSKPSRYVGQHLFIGLAGTELTPESRRLLHTIQPGGIVLFARNVESAPQLREFCRALHHELPSGSSIAIDQEHGRVNRLRNIIGEAPTIVDLKKPGDPAPAEDFGRTTGQRLHEWGIDIDFAPVLDLELFGAKADNALSGRCWGRTADEVTPWAGAFLDGLQGAGVRGCPKHFPGLGAATLDSHEKLPTISRTREQLLSEDIVPYVRLMPRLAAIMVGHGHYPAFDPGAAVRPASLSRAIITDLLRQRLGFTGLVVTDDMDMGAISQFGTVEQAAVEAVNAGADVVLVCHTAEKMLAAHDALAHGVESGRITSARLAEARERIRGFQGLRFAGRR
ncbi:MAG TPA: beta-N-acetylhexosaminidase [Verrucomicrobiae bacterium]|nr:beta-N-acetylhexosaminidase [Verrucomicrobiae bacterium]